MALKLKINTDTILKLPLSRRLIILGLVNLVIAGGIYWFLTGPKRDEARNLKQDLQNLEIRLRDSRTIAADIPRYRREKEEMDAKLKAAVAQLPNEKEIPDLIDSISLSGKKAGLKILLFRPGREEERDFYAEVPVNMTVEGRFESLYNFSVKVGTLPRIVNIGNMNITSAGRKGRAPVLKANFVATTFRFIPVQAQEGRK